jgi:hypothetical protein
MDVLLSLETDDLDTDSIGYQAPLPKEEVTPTSLEELTSRPRR